jgi:hypothetical protein
MSRKQTKIPFIATHKLTAQTKVGTETVDVMAVVQDGQTRLFDAAEADEGRLPEWKATTVITSSTKLTSGADGCRLQKNRKDAAGAELVRVNEIVYFTLEDGELKSTRATLDPIAAPTAPASTPAVAPVATSEGVMSVNAANPAAALLDAAATATTEAPKAARKPRQKAPPKAPAPEPTVGPDGRKHREGSVQGMTVEQLRAEFEAKTGQPAPSHSIHYMRKMVLAARNGKREFKRKVAKVPTMTLTLDDAKLILSTKKTSPERLALRAKIEQWVADNTAPTETPATTSTTAATPAAA